LVHEHTTQEPNSSVLEPSNIPVFDIDVTAPAKERYRAVWQHFGRQILDVQNLFVNSLVAQNPYLEFFVANETQFKEVQPDVWGFADSLREELVQYQANYTTAQALLVNSVVDFNSFCTSIIALEGDDIAHVRNLDFDYPEYMQKLVYYQRFVNGSQELALAPSIAGFYGVYTALKPGEYSLSYNVRYEHDAKLSRHEAIWLNLHQELNSTVEPF